MPERADDLHRHYAGAWPASAAWRIRFAPAHHPVCVASAVRPRVGLDHLVLPTDVDGAIRAGAARPRGRAQLAARGGWAWSLVREFASGQRAWASQQVRRGEEVLLPPDGPARAVTRRALRLDFLQAQASARCGEMERRRPAPGSPEQVRAKRERGRCGGCVSFQSPRKNARSRHRSVPGCAVNTISAVRAPNANAGWLAAKSLVRDRETGGRTARGTLQQHTSNAVVEFQAGHVGLVRRFCGSGGTRLCLVTGCTNRDRSIGKRGRGAREKRSAHAADASGRARAGTRRTD